ncbi:hypothetical protein B0H12DRAFT_1077786 [Mycena haematopus]|nr:hypothetical protein B0H12DRAFT_1077786 [Mycena haematopus]
MGRSRMLWLGTAAARRVFEVETYVWGIRVSVREHWGTLLTGSWTTASSLSVQQDAAEGQITYLSEGIINRGSFNESTGNIVLRVQAAVLSKLEYKDEGREERPPGRRGDGKGVSVQGFVNKERVTTGGLGWGGDNTGVWRSTLRLRGLLDARRERKRRRAYYGATDRPAAGLEHCVLLTGHPFPLQGLSLAVASRRA